MALAVLLVSAVLTGLASQAIGLDWALDTAIIHGAFALGILLLAPWKSTVVSRGLKKKRPGRAFSLALLAMVVTAVVSGLIHSYGDISRIGALTVMQIHVARQCWHWPLRWTISGGTRSSRRHFDVDRRAFMRASALAAAAAGLWLAWEGTLQALGTPGSDRRFTGMHERGSHDPAGLPVTSWFDDPVPKINDDAWSVEVGGRTLTLAELELFRRTRFPRSSIAPAVGTRSRSGPGSGSTTWSNQTVSAASSPGRRPGMPEGSRSPTSTPRGWSPGSAESRSAPAMGFPARIVAPARRGFWWVKWVTRIETSPLPWWAQSPFPLT